MLVLSCSLNFFLILFLLFLLFLLSFSLLSTHYFSLTPQSFFLPWCSSIIPHSLYPHPFPASLYLIFSFFSSLPCFSSHLFSLFYSSFSIIPLLIFLISYSPFFLSPSFPTYLFQVFPLSSFPFPSCFFFSSFNSLLYSS